VRAEKIAVEGKGTLYRVGQQRLLVLEGTPYEMGLQHGKLMAREVKEDMQAFVHDWAAGDHSTSREDLLRIYARLEPFIPQRYKDEMRGIAEGAGVPLEDVHAAHAIPTRFHCSGVAAYGKATADGKLYHTRSLDYSLDIGHEKRAQENSVVIVYKPADGIAHAILSWAGFIGCVSGMNEKGISIGEMGSSSKDETYDGIPMVFMLREALYQGGTLEVALAVVRDAKRTCGYNFIFADGKIPDAAALEVTRSHFRALRASDEENNAPPHRGIECVVRRVNHFVSPVLAATQRKVYDPRVSKAGSWMGYKLITEYVQANYGKLDEYGMIRLLRMYPPEHSCLHQAVFCPSDLKFWAAMAKDPKKVRYAGAQNQVFQRYDLKAILSGGLIVVEMQEKPPIRRPEESLLQQGTVPPEKERYRTRPGADYFSFEPQGFDWKMVRIDRTELYDVMLLSFPSPMPCDVESNNTVYAEYYRPTGPGKKPGVVVLHILDGKFYIARMLARHLASKGINALFVQMAYYGSRAPQGRSAVKMLSGDVDRTVAAVRQTVADVRRAGLWLSLRDEVEPDKIGVAGVSLGAFVGSLALSADERFKRAVLVVGGGDIASVLWNGTEARRVKEKLVEQGYTYETLERKLRPVEPLTYAGNVPPGSVLMVNAKQDTIVPPECTEKLWEKMGKPEILWYDANHTGMIAYLFEIMEKAASHFSPNARPT